MPPRELWENIFNEEGGELLESPKEDVGEIVALLIIDKISPKVFLSNLEILLGGRGATPNSASHSILNPPQEPPWDDLPFWSRINRPHGVPLWFLAAYPDVMIWLDEEQEKHQQRNLDEGIAEFARFFGIKERAEDTKSSNGKIHPKYLKNLVQSYKEATKKMPETTVKLEDNIYAAAELLKILGSESNFTFIAENTTKFYLELQRNYGDRFPDEASLLVTAGILDAQNYIFVLRNIDPLKILDMGKRSLEATEPLLDFIIDLEVVLLGVGNQDISRNEIRVACESQRQNIARAVKKAKEEYMSNPRFAQNVRNFMEAPEFKSTREFIGIKE